MRWRVERRVERKEERKEEMKVERRIKIDNALKLVNTRKLDLFILYTIIFYTIA